MEANIDHRYPNCGFVYAGDTRMVFAPKHFATRSEADMALNDLVLQCANNWPEPTPKELRHIIQEMMRTYPDRKLYVIANEGLALVHDPMAPSLF